ncbi:DnaB-like helicase C-terminal domain-containing protein [Heyndrickxia oleronia]|jgi:replicative DNA helicase|uniref:DnaB-like helicase C-terminal domain-containing protein n=1 Tax=Heyndrickxia oleronia TaxID=38875 RepID=UPI00242DF6CC|nr:DnaB-like helicase C-terminal domain-containing protein [Heyndrickxia oleronia]MCI1593648.1 DNA helicase [Heyndrickxia oleronia]MCI1615945.1 DNA helicase [Heyndrickxia oleronia]MCI1746009.1 DNA helicase [Heyndrickxia oleronia]MCI1763949.1 DNA helicase [Heyndrickxia oleronia]
MSVVEKTFLGSLIKAEYLLRDTVIQPDHLESERHKELMRRMVTFKREGKNIDLLSFTTLPDLETFGGMSYLTELLSYADIKKFNDTEKIILELWKEREKRNILTLAAMNDWEIAKVIGELDKINQSKMEDHTSIHQALLRIYEAPWEEQHHAKGVTTGIKKLDLMTGGFQGGEVTIVAGRPSMGKTDVMLHFAKISGWAGFLPLVFSLEMPEKLITSRLMASTGGFNRAKMRDPKRMLTQTQKKKWSDVIGDLDETNLQIFDGAGQTVAEMRAKTRKLMHEFPSKKPVVFIDYLTLIQANEFYGGNPHLQVTEISKALKTMAKDFDCPVICLAQLNRSVETRANKRPMMSDIRESGSVEQDADIILFLYREAYYDKDSEDHSLEMIVSKNRNGPVGTIKVNYNEHTGAIEDRKEQNSKSS